MAKSLGLRGVGFWTADFVDYAGHPEQGRAMWDAIKVFKP
jgi:hypothetical protein